MASVVKGLYSLRPGEHGLCSFLVQPTGSVFVHVLSFGLLFQSGLS